MTGARTPKNSAVVTGSKRLMPTKLLPEPTKNWSSTFTASPDGLDGPLMWSLACGVSIPIAEIAAEVSPPLEVAGLAVGDASLAETPLVAPVGELVKPSDAESVRALDVRRRRRCSSRSARGSCR